jgi:hypothetical protein
MRKMKKEEEGEGEREDSFMRRGLGHGEAIYKEGNFYWETFIRSDKIYNEKELG